MVDGMGRCPHAKTGTTWRAMPCHEHDGRSRDLPRQVEGRWNIYYRQHGRSVFSFFSLFIFNIEFGNCVLLAKRPFTLFIVIAHTYNM